jgi:hypothetical protein
VCLATTFPENKKKCPSEGHQTYKIFSSFKVKLRKFG